MPRFCSQCKHVECKALPDSELCAHCEDGVPCPIAIRNRANGISATSAAAAPAPARIPVARPVHQPPRERAGQLCCCKPDCDKPPRKNSIYAHGHKPKPERKSLDQHLEKRAESQPAPAESPATQPDKALREVKLSTGARIVVVTAQQYEQQYKPKRWANPEAMELLSILDSVQAGEVAVLFPKAGDTPKIFQDRMARNFRLYGKDRPYTVKLTLDSKNGHVCAEKQPRKAAEARA